MWCSVSKLIDVESCRGESDGILKDERLQCATVHVEIGDPLMPSLPFSNTRQRHDEKRRVDNLTAICVCCNTCVDGYGSHFSGCRYESELSSWLTVFIPILMHVWLSPNSTVFQQGVCQPWTSDISTINIFVPRCPWLVRSLCLPWVMSAAGRWWSSGTTF